MLPTKLWPDSFLRQVRPCLWLLVLLFLIATSGCQIDFGSNPLVIQPLDFPETLLPDQSYTFRFVVTERATKAPVAAAPMEALLTLDDGTVLQLFNGEADTQGQITFTYKSAYRQPGTVAKLRVQAQDKIGFGEFRADVELLPSLLVLPRQLPSQLAPGSQTPIVLQIFDLVNQKPVAAVPVQAQLTAADNDEVLVRLQGESNANGEVTLQLNLPTDLRLRPVRLAIDAQSPIGEGYLERKLTVVAPVTIHPMTAPKSVFAGSEVTYTLRIDDNINRVPAAFSAVQVYLSGGDYAWGTPLLDDQADANGIVTFTFTAPNSTYPDSLYLDIRTQAFEGNATYTNRIAVNPTIALSLVGLAERVTPGSSSELHLRVWDNRAAAPAQNAALTIEIEDNDGTFQKRFEGTTDASGSFAFRLEPPTTVDNARLYLTVNATTASATGGASFGVDVRSGSHALITTDKPVYQPGQTIHTRLLVLDSVSNRPVAAENIELTIYDARGNRLIEQTLTTSAYGVASADLELDPQATSGIYQINIALDGAYNSHTVEVKPYTLPQFKIVITDTHPYYAPGATAEGTVEATYFFGKPVVDGQVVIRGYAPTALNAKQEAELFVVSGQTDATGRFAYQLPLPTTFRDQLHNKTSTVRLEVDVIDNTAHLEQSEATITLAEQPLLLNAVPEAGRLKPGLANLVYVQATHPDDSAAQTTLAVAVGDEHTWQTVTTDAFGLATLVVTPTRRTDLPLLVRYGDGNTTQQATIKLPVESQKTPSILLRPAAAEVTIGGTLELDLWVAQHELSAPATDAYIELVKAGQVMQTAVVPLQDNHGHIALPLDPQLVGTLLINAHLLLPGDQRASDARLILANPTPVAVAVTADATVYRPGDTAHLTIDATHNGQPQQGVVGVAIVDESVFALEGQEASFARTFFLLDRELRNARYAIHNFADLGDNSSPYDSYYSHQPARYRAVEPTLLEQLSADTATINQSRMTSLFAWMAQDLQATTVETAPISTTDEHPTSKPIQPTGALGIFVVVVAGAYAGRRKITPPLLALLMVTLSSFLWMACAPSAAAPGAPSSAPAPQAPTAPTAASAPRLRQFFPETLLWLPEQETDAQGQTTIAVPLADSITTWRVSVLFSDQAGNLGSAETNLRVFQDFFVDPQLPAQLTLGDDVLAPIQLYNYLDQPQQIHVEIAPAAWFSTTQELATTVTVAANDVTVVYLPLRITGVGDGHFAVTATSDQMGDRVQRPVQVVYNGEAQSQMTSGRLASDLTLPLSLPIEAITGTRQVTLRFYPNTLSQVRQGVDGLLRRPSDNGVDVITQNFANTLLLSLLRQSDAPTTDPLYRQAQRLSRQGYQRLLAYESEREPGGFGYFHHRPARPWLSAYLLAQLTEMKKFTYVDPQLINRVTSYLYSQQLPDGSWPADTMRYYGPWRPRQARLATTAYIAWMMAESGNYNQAAMLYLRQATPDELTDPYLQALVINALLNDLESKQQARAQLTQLAEQRHDDHGLAYWTTSLTTFQAAWGKEADMETTALIAYALLQSGQQPDLAQSALDYLLSRRDPDGAFATPQLTAVTLKALLLAAKHETPGQTATITVQLDDQPLQQLTLDAAAGEPQELTLTGVPPTSTLQVTVDGELVAPYQLIRNYVLPWTAVAAQSAATPNQPVAITTTFDRNTVALHEMVTMHTTISVTAATDRNRRPEMWVATLGLPRGFTPLPADLETLAAMRIVSAYEVGPNQLRLYLTRLYPGQSYALTLRLQATSPGHLQVLPSQFTELHSYGERTVDKPQWMDVTTP